MEGISQAIVNIKAIDKKSVHRICSGQVVLTLAMAVKELVENSIDAGATNIEVKLKEYGSECIEVSDNGSGVRECDFKSLTLKHHTSKLEDFCDLLSINTFGFRGEALSSLCALSTMSVVTCHKDAVVGTRLEYDHDGNIIKKTSIARPVGTTVTAENLFSTLPVRHKEFHRNLRKEFSKMIQLLTAYCLISVGIRITCVNSLKGKKTTVLSTNGDHSVKGHIACVFGSKQMGCLMDFVQLQPSEAILEEFYLNSVSDCAYSIEGYVSTTTQGAGRSTADRQFFFINGRPCDLPKVAKIVNDVYHTYNKNQYPFVCLNIAVKKELADVNVTPDKRQIFMQEEKLLLAIIKTSILALYGNQTLTFKHFSSPLFKENLSQGCTVDLNNSNKEGSPSLPSLKRQISISSIEDELASFNTKNAPVNDNPDPNLSESCLGEKSMEIVEESGMSAFNSETANGEKELSKCIKVVEKQQNFHVGEKLYQPKVNSFFKSYNESDINFTTTVPFKETKIENKVKMKDYDHSSCRSLLLKNFTHGVEKTLKGFRLANSFSQSPEKPNTKKSLRKKCKVDDFSSNDESNIDFIISQHKSDFHNVSQRVSLSSHNVLQEDGMQNSVSSDNDDLICDSSVVDLDELHRRKRKVVSCEFSFEIIRERLQHTRNSKNDLSSQNIIYRKFRSKINAEDAETELRKEISKDMFKRMEVIGQFNLGFIIAKLDDDLFIIDQHATDEKYNFEILQKDTILETQLLLNPQTLELTAASEATLLDNIHIFEKNGFKFKIMDDEIPGRRVQLFSVPVSQNWSFGKDDVDELIFILGDNPGRLCRPSKVCKMFASRACRKSVMIGTPLSPQIMKKLLSHMGEIEQPWNCPHGRPTMRHLFSMNLLYHK